MESLRNLANRYNDLLRADVERVFMDIAERLEEIEKRLRYEQRRNEDLLEIINSQRRLQETSVSEVRELSEQLCRAVQNMERRFDMDPFDTTLPQENTIREDTDVVT